MRARLLSIGPRFAGRCFVGVFGGFKSCFLGGSLRGHLAAALTLLEPCSATESSGQLPRSAMTFMRRAFIHLGGEAAAEGGWGGQSPGRCRRHLFPMTSSGMWPDIREQLSGSIFSTRVCCRYPCAPPVIHIHKWFQTMCVDPAALGRRTLPLPTPHPPPPPIAGI